MIMIKRVTSIFSVLALCLLLWNCGVSSTIQHDYDPQYPFRLVRTFAFSKTAVDQVNLLNDLDKRRVLYAMDQALLSKGLLHQDKTPDLKLGFRMTKVRQSTPTQVGFGFGGPWWFLNSTRPVIQERYVIHIQAHDQKSNILAWEGQGVLPIERAMNNPQKRNEVFNKVIAKILKRLPVETQQEMEIEQAQQQVAQ